MEFDNQTTERAQRTLSAIKRGWAAIELRRAAVAEREARAALALEPESVEARLLLIEALHLQKRSDEAVPVVEEALALAPDEPMVQQVACLIYCERFELDRALGAANAYARLDPDSATAHVLFAEVTYRGGTWQASVAYAERALAVDPDNIVALERLGLASLHIDPRQAEAAFLRQLALEPNQSTTLNNLGVSLERQGRLWEAAKLFASAVRLDPTNELARNNTRSTLKRWSSPAAALGLGGAALAAKSFLPAVIPGIASGLSRQSPAVVAGIVAALIAIIGAAVLGGWLIARARSARRLRELARSDPALHAMFLALERDAAREATSAPDEGRAR